MHSLSPRRSAPLPHRLSTLLSGCCARWSGSLVALLLALVPTAAAHAQVFSSPTIVDGDSGPAQPYPSTINVSGVVDTSPIVVVRLKGFLSLYPAGVAVLLVAPNGQGIELLSLSGGPTEVIELTLAFSSLSTTPLPAPLQSGTFQPAGGTTGLAPPANSIPRAASLAALAAGNPNGQWRLFVDASFGGVIVGLFEGWELEFSPSPLPTTPLSPTTITYQGRLDGDVTTGTIDARFSVWNHPSSDNILNRVAAPVTVSGVTVTDGLFTAPVTLGTLLPTDVQTWLQLEVSNPAGAPFETLLPRQPITATPLAGAAINAVNAANVASGGFAVGSLIGPGGVIGFNQHDVLNRGVKSRVGYSIVPTGLAEFAGMMSSVVPGTNGCGNSADITFHTWECSTSVSREIMRINGRGNVGIGTVNPTQRLTVAGNVLANNVAVPSSGRFKHNVLPMTDALEKVLQLDGVTFDWNADFAKDRPGREHDLGFVAEDVARVFPEVVFYDAEGNVTGMDYSRLTAVAIAAIKQQQAQRESDRASFAAELAKRDAENADLKARLEAIEAALLKMSTDHK